MDPAVSGVGLRVKHLLGFRATVNTVTVTTRWREDCGYRMIISQHH